MENEYIVSTADLTAVADAIRVKSNISGELIFPNEFISAVDSIPNSVVGNRMYLYKAGDKCEGITGGWTTQSNAYSSSVSKGTTPATSWNASSVTLANKTYDATGGIRTMVAVDLTDYSYLELNYNFSTPSNWGYIAVSSATGGYVTAFATLARFSVTGSNLSSTLNVANLTGKYYIFVGCYNGGDTTTGTTVTVHNLSAVKLNT